MHQHSDDVYLKTKTWIISSLEAGIFAFSVTATSLVPDSKKKVSNYLLKEEKEGGQERWKSNPGKLCGKDTYGQKFIRYRGVAQVDKLG